MSLQIPDEIKWLSWVIGSDWPEGDEDAMWRLGAAYRDAGHQIEELTGDMKAAATAVLGAVQGPAADQFSQFWDTFIATDPRYLQRLAELCYGLADDCDKGGTDIEYAKYMFIAMLIMTAIAIYELIAAAFATFGGSLAAEPVVYEGAQIASKTILRQLIEAIAKSAGKMALQNIGLDGLIQGIQIAEGHRKNFDVQQNVMSGVNGLISGAVMGGVGVGVGHIPGLSGEANSLGGSIVKGVVRDGIAGVVGGAGGAAVSTLATGGHLSANSLLKAGVAGGIGGGIGGATEGLKSGDHPTAQPASSEGGGSDPGGSTTGSSDHPAPSGGQTTSEHPSNQTSSEHPGGQTSQETGTSGSSGGGGDPHSGSGGAASRGDATSGGGGSPAEPVRPVESSEGGGGSSGTSTPQSTGGSFETRAAAGGGGTGGDPPVNRIDALINTPRTGGEASAATPAMSAAPAAMPAQAPASVEHPAASGGGSADTSGQGGGSSAGASPGVHSGGGAGGSGTGGGTSLADAGRQFSGASLDGGQAGGSAAPAGGSGFGGEQPSRFSTQDNSAAAGGVSSPGMMGAPSGIGSGGEPRGTASGSGGAAASAGRPASANDGGTIRPGSSGDPTTTRPSTAGDGPARNTELRSSDASRDPRSASEQQAGPRRTPSVDERVLSETSPPAERPETQPYSRDQSRPTEPSAHPETPTPEARPETTASQVEAPSVPEARPETSGTEKAGGLEAVPGGGEKPTESPAKAETASQTPGAAPTETPASSDSVRGPSHDPSSGAPAEASPAATEPGRTSLAGEPVPGAPVGASHARTEAPTPGGEHPAASSSGQEPAVPSGHESPGDPAVPHDQTGSHDPVDRQQQVNEIQHEAQQIADQFGVDAPHVDFSGMDPESARAVTDAMRDLAREYPETFRQLNEIKSHDFEAEFGPGEASQETYAYAIPAGEEQGIYLNDRIFNDHEELSAKGAYEEATGWTVPGGGSPEGIFYHEFGHQMGERILADPLMREELNRAVSEVIGREYDASAPHDLETEAAIAARLSEYGASNPHEMLAEAFAEHKLADNPRPLARAIGEVIDRHFAGEHGATTEPGVHGEAPAPRETAPDLGGRSAAEPHADAAAASPEHHAGEEPLFRRERDDGTSLSSTKLDPAELARREALLDKDNYYIKQDGTASRYSVDRLQEDGNPYPKIEWDGEKWVPQEEKPVVPAKYLSDPVLRDATETQKQVNQTLVDRRADAIRRVDAANATPEPERTPPQQEDRRQAYEDQTKAGEELGERAAAHFVQDRYGEYSPEPDPRHPQGKGAGYFDQVWKYTKDGETHYVVVEAKGPSARLGDREGLDGRQYQQGRPEYVESILNEMQRRGGEEARLAFDLADAWDTPGRLDYHEVRARVDETPAENADPTSQQGYGGFREHQFDLRRDVSAEPAVTEPPALAGEAASPAAAGHTPEQRAAEPLQEISNGPLLRQGPLGHELRPHEPAATELTSTDGRVPQSSVETAHGGEGEPAVGAGRQDPTSSAAGTPASPLEPVPRTESRAEPSGDPHGNASKVGDFRGDGRDPLMRPLSESELARQVQDNLHLITPDDVAYVPAEGRFVLDNGRDISIHVGTTEDGAVAAYKARYDQEGKVVGYDVTVSERAWEIDVPRAVAHEIAEIRLAQDPAVTHDPVSDRPTTMTDHLAGRFAEIRVLDQQIDRALADGTRPGEVLRLQRDMNDLLKQVGLVDDPTAQVRRDLLAAHDSALAERLVHRDAELEALRRADAEATARPAPLEKTDPLGIYWDENGVRHRETPSPELERLLADERIQRMLEQADHHTINDKGHMLGDVLHHELNTSLPKYPKLERLLRGEDLTAVEQRARNALLSRPMTLHKLLNSPEEVHTFYHDALREVNGQGPEAFQEKQNLPVSVLNEEQQRISDAMTNSVREASGGRPPDKAPSQPGFDATKIREQTEGTGDHGEPKLIPSRKDPYLKEYREQLYDGARDATIKLDALLKDIAAQTGGDEKMRQAEKDRVRSMDKIMDYEGNAAKLNDLLGGKVVYHMVAELYSALGRIEAIAAQHRIQIVAFDDRVANPVDSGYRDLQMRVRMPNGHIGELRLHLTAIDLFADHEHALYEVKRDFKAIAKEENRELTPEETAIAEAIDRNLREKFGSNLKSALPPSEE